MKNKPRIARKLERTLRKAERLRDQIADPNIPEIVKATKVEIKSIAETGIAEVQEVAPEIGKVGQFLAVAEVILDTLDVSEEDVNAIADAVNGAIDIPGVPEWMEQWFFRQLAHGVWSAIEQATQPD